MTDLEPATQEVLARIHECARSVVRRLCDEQEKPILRQIAHAYLYKVHKERSRFLLALFANRCVRTSIEAGEGGEHFLSNFIVRVQARWEFEHVDVFGCVSDAMCLASRYRTCARFIEVHPLEPDDPFSPYRIPMRHKETSPWYRAFRRRMELKAALGRHRALVGYARKHTKRWFLEEWRCPKEGERRQYEDGTWHIHAKRVPHLEDHTLLQFTGYTPEELWREVHHPNSIPPRKPQLEFSL